MPSTRLPVVVSCHQNPQAHDGVHTKLDRDSGENNGDGVGTLARPFAGSHGRNIAPVDVVGNRPKSCPRCRRDLLTADSDSSCPATLCRIFDV